MTGLGSTLATFPNFVVYFIVGGGLTALFVMLVGSWVVAGKAAGIGMREDKAPITGNTSRFVPHYFR